MSTRIITPEDLVEFKKELLEEIRRMLNQQSVSPSKKWLKSTEVMKLLKISPGTLQTFRINGTLPYTKVGGIIYYDSVEIEKTMASNRVHHKS